MASSSTWRLSDCHSQLQTPDLQPLLEALEAGQPARQEDVVGELLGHVLGELGQHELHQLGQPGLVAAAHAGLEEQLGGPDLLGVKVHLVIRLILD
mgnify:CR=1 FL=1